MTNSYPHMCVLEKDAMWQGCWIKNKQCEECFHDFCCPKLTCNIIFVTFVVLYWENFVCGVELWFAGDLLRVLNDRHENEGWGYQYQSE